MRSKKLLLSEEISRMAEIFSHMGINLLMEGRLLGREAGTGVEALVPGSTIRNLVGETTAKNIEDDLIRAAQQSQNVMKQLGKNIGDTITMDDLETTFFASNRAATAAKVLDAMEPAGAKSFMDNTANYIFNKNSSTSGTRAGTTDASLQTLNSLIKRDMSVVTADNILNNISTFRNAIDNLADDTQKANWKKSLDLAETQAKTVKLKPTETTGPTPGPSPRPVIGDEPPPLPPNVTDAVDNWDGSLVDARAKIEELIDQLVGSKQINLKGVDKNKLINDAYDTYLGAYNYTTTNLTEEMFKKIPPTRRDKVIEDLVNEAKRRFKESGGKITEENEKTFTKLLNILTYGVKNKSGEVTIGSFLKWWGLGMIVSTALCGAKEVAQDFGTAKDETETSKEEIAYCLKMSLLSWYGGLVHVGGLIVEGFYAGKELITGPSYENTVESFEQFLKDNDIKYVSAQQDSEGVNQYYYIPEGDGEGVTYEFKNNTFEKK
jgi:hypothetical protein